MPQKCEFSEICCTFEIQNRFARWQVLWTYWDGRRATFGNFRDRRQGATVGASVPSGDLQGEAGC